MAGSKANRLLPLGLVSALLLGCAYAVAQGVPSNPSEEILQRRKVWEGALRMALADLPSNVLIDVEAVTPPPSWSGALQSTGSRRLELLSSLLHREARQAEGTTVLVRSRASSTALDGDRLQASRWLADVPEDELILLAGKGAEFARLSPATQRLVATLCDAPGLQERILNGKFVRVTVRLTLAVQANDRRGETHSFPLDPFQHVSEEERAETARQAEAYRSSRPDVSPAMRPSVGPLDFSAGRLLTLRELLAEAGPTFKKDFYADSRLLDSTYFVKGRYTQAAFMAALRLVTTTLPPGDASEDAMRTKDAFAKDIETRWATLGQGRKLPKGFNLDDVRNGRLLGPQELGALGPEFNRALEAENIAPSAAFRLVPGFALSASAPGTSAEQGRSVSREWSILFTP